MTTALCFQRRLGFAEATNMSTVPQPSGVRRSCRDAPERMSQCDIRPIMYELVSFWDAVFPYLTPRPVKDGRIPEGDVPAQAVSTIKQPTTR